MQFIKKYYRLILFIFIATSVISWSIYKIFIEEDEGAIHIAVVGPMSGDDSVNGIAYQNGINLYFDSINKKGGIKGRKLILDVYDDLNKKETAKEMAEKILKDNKAVAVIGHNSSTCSIEGGKVYKNKIPAITPSSTNVDVTKNNEWYFRTIFNDNAQGRYLANYAKKVLKEKVFSIIYDDKAYGVYLSKVYEETLNELDVKIEKKYFLDTSKPDVEEQILRIAKEVEKDKKNAGLIFMATGTKEGARLIKEIKDLGVKNQILAPDGYASKLLQKTLSEFPNEKKNPGYYSNGIYVTTPLIFDNANSKAQSFRQIYKDKYKAEPDWRAVYAYDSAMVISEAIRKNDIKGQKHTLTKDRQTIQHFLSEMKTPEDAIEGATGYNFFVNGDSPKPISIGVYKNNNIISALMQLQFLRDLREISNVKKAVEEGRIIEIDGKYLYKTNVIYTGIEINEISELALDRLIYNLDFYLWFRYKEDIKPEEIEFLNTYKQVMTLEKPSKDSDTTKVELGGVPMSIKQSAPQEAQMGVAQLGAPIEIDTSDNMIYKVYHVKGFFKADTMPVKFVLGQHSLGVSFRHKKLTRNNLLYVTDMIGLGLTHGKDIAQAMRNAQTLSPVHGWSIHTTNFSQDVLERSTLGAPKYLNTRDGKAEYSRFNMTVMIRKDEFSLRGLIPDDLNVIFFSISASTIIGLIFLGRLKYFHKFSNVNWIIITLCIFMGMVSGEAVLVDQIMENANTYNLKMTTLAFDILWWLIPAKRFNQGVEIFVWVPLEKKVNHTIPTVVRLFLAFIVYLLTIFGIVAFVFDQKITSLLATSGMAAMIIGLAIQVNIANIFSGIAINIERPFRVGDWVKIGEWEEGKVVDITWRTTRILTRQMLILSIPNSKASESPIQNFSMPDGIVEAWFTVHIDPNQPTKVVQKILMDALYASEGVLKNPAPYCRLNQLTEWAADYLFGYSYRDYGKKNAVRKAVWTSVWTHLYRAGIQPATQRQEVFFFKGQKARGEVASQPMTILQEVDVFNSFSFKEKSYLAKKMRIHVYDPGDMIVQIGDTSRSMFIIAEGAVSVQAKNNKDEFFEITNFGSGSFFGEMALLTGAVRTANVVAVTKSKLYEITLEDIQPLLSQHPEIYNMVKTVVTQRGQNLEKEKSLHEYKPPVIILPWYKEAWNFVKAFLMGENK